MKVISHSADADGIVSAYLVAKKFGLKDPGDFIMTDYGKHTDFLSKISDGEEVVICDFSFEGKSDDMKKLFEKTDKVTWIDHHKSAIEEYGNYGKNIPGLRVDGISASMLTYCYYFLMDSGKEKFDHSMVKAAPWLVQYVDDHDVWKYEFPNTEFFNLGWLAAGITSPLDEKIDRLYNHMSEIYTLIDTGVKCKGFRDSLGKRACTEDGFEVELGGFKGFALNNCFGGSQWFGDLVEKYDFICPFYWMGKEKVWEYSFYSKADSKCDCAKLAQSINPSGGGHLHAAGCTSDKFIFGDI